MAILHTPAKVHWTFFTAVEQDVELLARYVEPVPANYGAFSLEMCRILFAASAECEVVLKEILGLFGMGAKKMTIDGLRNGIIASIPDLCAEKVFIPRYGLELDPWENWRSNKNPEWWTGYNKVKHNRQEHYDKGNLQNALNAAAGLMVVVIYFYQKQLSGGGKITAMPDVTACLSPESRLFALKEERYPAMFRIR